MPWTDTARREHKREGLGYPNDLRDAKWELIAPMLPVAWSGPARRLVPLGSAQLGVVHRMGS